MKRSVSLIAGVFVLAIAACNSSTTPNTPAGTQEPAKEAAPAASNDPEGLALMKKSDCATCHAKESKVIGPSYKDIAAKYEKTPANVETLSGRVIKGGSGIWGQVPMTPHSLPKQDVDKMVDYILTK